MAVVNETHSIRIVFGEEGDTRSETQNYLKPEATDTQCEEFVNNLSNLISDPVYSSFRNIRKQFG